MNLNLALKTALVCGGSQGIGKASAYELALLGANVTIVARNEANLKAVVQQLPNNGHQTHQYIVADLEDLDATKIALENYLLTSPEVHILINNASGPKGGALIDAEIEDFQKAFNAHILAAQLITKAVLPSMQAANYGRIVNITSVGQKQPLVGLGVSNTIRGAMASWAKTMSMELGKFGITVNNILPGYTLTNRLAQVNAMRAETLNLSISEVEKAILKDIPIGRFTLPQETAALVAFLCSPAAAAISGTNIPVDGGKTSTF